MDRQKLACEYEFGARWVYRVESRTSTGKLGVLAAFTAAIAFASSTWVLLPASARAAAAAVAAEAEADAEAAA